ncbi:MAG: hypothetical protein NTV54_07935 [Ignavibacteriales bacterium]|nr:hypothetical protein [Ignavibacteriales bacterium]
MSCPDCGAQMKKEQQWVLISYIASIVVLFSISLLWFPFFLFVLISVLLLGVLHRLEKQFRLAEDGVMHCPACGHVFHMQKIRKG